jgi:hypothetical protein
MTCPKISRDLLTMPSADLKVHQQNPVLANELMSWKERSLRGKPPARIKTGCSG